MPPAAYEQFQKTQVRDQGMGAALFGFSKLYGVVPGAQAEQADGTIKVAFKPGGSA